MLTPQADALIDYIEQAYLLRGVIPSLEATQEYLDKFRGITLSLSELTELVESQEVKDAFGRRGIDTNANVPGYGLTPDQLAAANLLLDFSDRRSSKVKLESLGLTTAKYQAWLRNPNFQAYTKERAENLLGDVTHEAHSALVKNMEKGDLRSIQLYYEMTGRWSSKTVGDLNVEFLMIKILETIQRHVKDPEMLRAIAGDLSSLNAPAPVAEAETIALEPTTAVAFAL